MSQLMNKIFNLSVKRAGTSLNVFRKLSIEQHTNTSASSSLPSICIPSMLSLAQTENHWIYQRNEKIRMPISQKHHIELPKNIIYPTIIEDPLHNEKIIDEPPQENDNHMEATRMIVIRRQKMKNHKLKKLRKRLKFERAKIRQRRELKKEKEFQAVLIQQCKEAEEFSAEEYVQSRIQKYQEALSYVPKKKITFYRG